MNVLMIARARPAYVTCQTLRATLNAGVLLTRLSQIHRRYLYSHVTDKETEAQRGAATGPRSHSRLCTCNLALD